jgi:hypothetical protein
MGRKKIKAGSIAAALPLIQETNSQISDLLGTIFGNGIRKRRNSKPKKIIKARGVTGYILP